MTKQEQNKKELTNEEKLEQAKDFVFALLHRIPNKTLNDKHMRIYDTKNDEDLGTLQEYINKNLYEIWGIKIKWD